VRAWSVYVEHRVAGDVDDAVAEVVMDDVVGYGGVVVVGDRRVGARITVEASEAGEAALAGAQVVAAAVYNAGLQGTEPVRLEVVDEADLARESMEPTFPDVIGSTEVAEMLGVTRQRLHQLRAREEFPQPIVELAATPVWLRAAIKAYGDRRPRIQGAPGHRAASGVAPPPGRRHWIRNDAYHWSDGNPSRCAGCGRDYPSGRDFGAHLADEETLAGGPAARPVPTGNAKRFPHHPRAGRIA
jgi:predicted DNA-binding transcriptional regulator AlpA